MVGRVQCVVLDCADVRELARFYAALLGGEVNRPDPRWAVGDEFATVHTEGDQSGSGLVLAFQRVADHRAPQWPDAAHPQQVHLDVDVPDMDEAHERVVGLGAALLRVDSRGWRVYADPAGHPFCLLGG
ncbi:VOC family protein [Embleya sp. NPDC005575]|uniref:VOC family protein n=1 Tax=Embleya sp. NPDC005575 TaxID=3156892 RepID=UPI0033ABD44F